MENKGFKKCYMIQKGYVFETVLEGRREIICPINCFEDSRCPYNFGVEVPEGERSINFCLYQGQIATHWNSNNFPEISEEKLEQTLQLLQPIFVNPLKRISK